jgi:hypothetical protein
MKITKPPILAAPPAPTPPALPPGAVLAAQTDRAVRLRAPRKAAPEFGRALVVIHGIGQQQPFEPLDSFTNGLRTVLHRRRPSDPAADAAVHVTLGRDGAFDHAMRIPGADLDIYEVYWAPLTQRKATVGEILRWLVQTSFTPIRQFAFNLPLVFRRADIQWQGANLLHRALALIFSIVLAVVAGIRRPGPGDVVPGDDSALRWSWYILCLLRELLRMAVVLLVGLAVVALVAGLVSSSATLLGELPGIWREVLLHSISWRDSLTAAVFVAALTAALVVFTTLLPQLRVVMNDATPPPSIAPPPLRPSLVGRLAAWVAERRETQKRLVQSEARMAFFLLSLLVLIALCWLLYRLTRPDPLCLGRLCLSDIVPSVLAWLGPEGRRHLLVIGGVAALAALVKAFILDYVADVALYTVSDENSPFAQVRRDVLAVTTAKVKWLLRQYQAVTVAGHSLGSVVGYDTINWLRGEARVAESQAADIRRRGDALRALLRKTVSEPAAKNADALIVRIAEAFGPNWAATGVGHAQQALQQLEALLREASVDDQAVADARHAIEELVKKLADPATAPLSRAELNRITTLVTFGSPLNKVLYFFRTRVGSSQTVRGHIINDLHGFRLQPDLFASDPGITDDGMAGKFDNATPPDGLYWLNVWAPLDFVSASLDFYDGVHEYRRWFVAPFACHTSYWRDGRFYEEVLAAIQQKANRARAPLFAAKP